MANPIFTDEEKNIIEQSLEKKGVYSETGMPTFTDEEKALIDQGLQKKNIDVSAYGAGRINTFKSNLSQERLDEIRGGRDIFAEATEVFAPLSATATETEKKEREQKLKRQMESKAILAFYTANSLKGDPNNAQKDIEEFARKYGERFGNITKEDILKLKSHELLEEWNDVTGEYGVLPKSVLFDEQFSDNVDIDTYKYLCSTYNLMHDNGGWARGWKSAQLQRVANIDYQEGKISLPEYEKQLEQISARYSMPDDGLLSSTSSLVSGMWSPIRDNPVTAIAGAMGGVVAGVMGAPALVSGAIVSGAMWGLDTFQQSSADSLYRVQSVNPDADREETIRANAPYNALAAGIDIGADAITGGILRIGKPLTAIGQKAIRDVEKSGVKQAIKETAQKSAVNGEIVSAPLADRINHIIRKSLGEGVINIAQQSATEGAQDALAVIGAGKTLGQQDHTTYAQAFEQGKESFKEAISPISVLTLGMMTPGVTAQIARMARHSDHVSKSVKTKITGEVLADMGLNKRDPVTGAEVVDKTLTSRVYMDADEVNNALKTAGIEPSSFGAKFEQALNNAKNGDSVELTIGQWSNLPTEARDFLAVYASNEEGYIDNKILESLSDQKIEELKKEFAEKEAEFNAHLEQVQAVENDINLQIKSAERNTSVEQNNAIGKTVGAFVSAMSRSLGVDVNELYSEIKPTYKKHDVHDSSLTAEQRTGIDDPKVHADFDPAHNVIRIKPNADFNDVFHETAHWFLNSLYKLSAQHKELQGTVEQVVEWASGEKKTYAELTAKDINEAQEQFVAGLLVYSLSGDIDARAKPALSNFKRFLSSLKNTSLYANFSRIDNENTAGDKREFIKRGFKATYGKDLPQINESFKGLVDTLFNSQTLADYQRMEYPADNHLHELDNSGFAPEIKDTLKSMLRDNIAEEEARAKDAFDAFSIKQAMLYMVQGEELQKYLDAVKEHLPKNLQEKEQVLRDLKKLEKYSKSYKQHSAQHLEELKKQPLFVKLDEIKELKLNVDGLNLSDDSLKLLKRRGYLATDNAYLAPSDYVKELDALPLEMQAYIKNSAFTPDMAFVDFLVKQPTAEEQAKALAMQDLLNESSGTQQKDFLDLQKKIIQGRKKEGREFIKAVQSARGAREAVNDQLLQIEALAQRDIDDLAFNQAVSRSFSAKASRANEHVKDAIAKGDLNETLRHARNEYYQNCKAEYSAVQRARIQNSFKKLADFIKKDGKTAPKGYDPELVDVMRNIMGNIGVTKFAKRGLRDLLEHVDERYPQYAERIKSLAEELEIAPALNTYWKNQSIGDLKNIVRTLEELKTMAHDAQMFRTEKGDLELEKVTLAVNAVLDANPDKSLKLEITDKDGKKIGVSSTGKRTAWTSFTALARSYFNQTRLVEQACQKFDGVEMGAMREFLYQPVKDAETEFKLKNNEVLNAQAKAINSIKHIIGEQIICPEFRRKDADGKAWVMGTNDFKGQTTLEIMGILLHRGANFTKFLNGYLADDYKIPSEVERMQNSSDARERAEYQRIKKEVDQKNLEAKKQHFDDWLNRGIREGWITKELLDACQAIWDINKQQMPMIQRASLLLRGYRFKELNTEKFSVNIDGKTVTYEAGYVPALANRDVMSEHTIPKSKNIGEMLANGSQEFAELYNLESPSFVKERTNISRALELDPRILIAKTTDTIRYAVVLPKVMQVYKLLNSAEVRMKLEQKAPDFFSQVLTPWLETVAEMKTSRGEDGRCARFVANFVRGVGMATMCLNVNNALQQVSNITALCQKVSPSVVIKNLTPAMFNYTELCDQAMAESKFMAVRIPELNNGINEIFDKLLLDPKMFDDPKLRAKARIGNVKDWSERHAYILQKKFQNYLDVASYTAAKEQALKEGKSLKDAISYAEMVVRTTQGSFDVADTAAISKGSAMMKMLSQFGGYFFTMYRLMETGLTISKKRYNDNRIKALLSQAYVVSCALLMPSIVAELVNQAVGTGDLWGDDDDNDNALMTNLLLAPVKMQVASMPVIGKALNSTLDELSGKQYFSSSALLSNPALTTIFAGYNGAKTIITPDKNLTGRDIKSLILLGATIMHLPMANPLGRATGYGCDIAVDRIVPDSVAEGIRGFVTGRASERTKNY